MTKAIAVLLYLNAQMQPLSPPQVIPSAMSPAACEKFAQEVAQREEAARNRPGQPRVIVNGSCTSLLDIQVEGLIKSLGE